jgi:predicted dehydrogenase
MGKKIRTVIIGMGRMGATRYQAMKRHGGFQIVAICDSNLNNMEGYKEVKYQDWKECIDACEPQAVVVCTYNMVIPDVVCYALGRGIAVFSEKPPGRTLEDALKMQEAQLQTGTILKFGFNHRVHNSIIEAKALIDSKILGDVVCIRGVYGKAGNDNFQNEWRNNRSISGGGILLDQGIHMLDLMCYLTDSDMHVVNGNVSNLVWKDMDTEDSALAMLETEKGQQISIHSSAIQWRHKFDMDIICTNGYIALNGLLTSTHSYGEERITYYKKDLGMKTGRLGKPKEYTMCFDMDSSWDIEMEEFYEVVVNGKELVNGKPEDAVRVMRIIQEIYEYKQK